MKILLLAYLILSSYTSVLAQNFKASDNIKRTTQDLYEKAQHALNPFDKIKYSNQALMTIMAQTDDAYLIANSELIIPILKFNAEACISYLSQSSQLNEDTKDGLFYSIERDTQTLFYFIKLNSKIEFLWNSLTVEDIYYIIGRAKYYAGIPYKDDLAKAGQKGINFLKQRQSNSVYHGNIQEDYDDYLTYYNERFGYYITYPSYLYIQGEGQNGAGKSFYSHDAQIKLSVGAYHNILNENATNLLATQKQDFIGDNHSIIYTFAKDNKVIVSGYTPQGRIYYQKSVICTLYSSIYKEKVNIITTAYVEYPSTEKVKGDEIIKLFNKFPYK